MHFSTTLPMIALAATTLLTTTTAIPIVGEAGTIIARDPSRSHHGSHSHTQSKKFTSKTAIALGKKLLHKADKTLSSKEHWAKEKSVGNWTKHYGPSAKHNFKQGLLDEKDQGYLKDVLESFGVDVTTEQFSKFVVFSGKGNGTKLAKGKHHGKGHKKGGKKHGHAELKHAHEHHDKDASPTATPTASPTATDFPSASTSTAADSPSATESSEPKGKPSKLVHKIKHQVSHKHGKHAKGHGKHVHAKNKHPKLPVLIAEYSSQAIVLKSLHHSHDHNKKKNMLHMYELLYQGAVHTGSKATTFVRVAPSGKTIKSFIAKAKKAADKNGSLKLAGADKKTKNAFAMLLGTPAGKAIEELCIHHPSYYGGRSVKEIRIVGEAGHESIVYIVS